MFVLKTNGRALTRIYSHFDWIGLYFPKVCGAVSYSLFRNYLFVHSDFVDPGTEQCVLSG